VFGNIFKRKQRILKRLEGINRVLQEGNNDHLIQLKFELWEEYRLITQQEENYCFQQARSKWITLGDNNTRYFHQSTLVRRRRNKIMALQDAEDQWIYDEDDLKQHVLDFYHQLYSTSGQVYPNFISITTFPNISDVDMTYLGSTVTSHEVRRALFSMKSYKSPGPDGFHPIFFKNQWDIVGNSIVKFVSECFVNPNKIKEVNHTLITLIPKCQEPAKVTQLRPIALRNVIYKIVTKVVAQRIRSIIPYVVSNTQSSFIPGRNTTDNILVLQETIHSLNHMHGKKGFMILKIDLEKAYDRIEWEFIRETLALLNLPMQIQNLVHQCISSASMSINWNGEPTSKFHSSRGLRQGDPLSPYLFVLALERLGHYIQEKVNNGSWKPLPFGRGGPKVSHICFADDLVLIA
jgi:hypothetical protein